MNKDVHFSCNVQWCGSSVGGKLSTSTAPPVTLYWCCRRDTGVWRSAIVSTKTTATSAVLSTSLDTSPRCALVVPAAALRYPTRRSNNSSRVLKTLRPTWRSVTSASQVQHLLPPLYSTVCSLSQWCYSCSLILRSHKRKRKYSTGTRMKRSWPAAFSTLASSTRRTVIVNNRFRASRSVYNSWQHLWCNDGRARFTTAAVWRRVAQEAVLVFARVFIWNWNIISPAGRSQCDNRIRGVNFYKVGQKTAPFSCVIVKFNEVLGYWRFMQIRQRIFNCTDTQIMHFILDKVLKLFTLHAFLSLVVASHLIS